MNERTLLSVAFGLLFSLLQAQQTAVFTDAHQAFREAEQFYEQNLFGQAHEAYRQTIRLTEPAHEPEFTTLRKFAELGVAKCAIRLNLPDGEKNILDFIRTYRPDPLANQALIEVANYFFDDKQYDKAVEYLSQVPTYELSQEKRAEVRYKMGYAFFVQKKFREAKNNFNEIRNTPGDYFFPANYYYGLCEFFLGNYDSAIKAFRVAERYRRYQPHIPYYIAQIYFAQGKYEDVIRYAEPKLNDSSLKRIKELHQLVGQAYFELGEYAKALPHLEFYEERSGKLREEEFYQLAFTQYQVGKYREAIRNFEELDRSDSELGQYALYYLGDANLKLGRKTAARNAFFRASEMNYDPSLKEEALFNYAKLSYELKFDREALSALQRFTPSSKYYNEAQKLMSELFLNTRDYERALSILENLPNRTPQLNEAYQKVAYLRGLQLYREGELNRALEFFNKSLSQPVNLYYKALATYWLADIAHQQKKYRESINLLNEFLTLAKGMRDLPDEASVFTANYLQGYNYLKQKNYTGALGYFQDAVAGIKRNSMFISNPVVREEILADATLRAGDCLFKRNRYSEAARFYNEAIRNGYPGFEYALYQKALIEGLRGRTTEKILALENLINNHPRSEYTDDALFQLGITYQEFGQLDKALEPLKRLVTQYPNSPFVNRALLRMGLITYNRGNYQTAMEYYKQVFRNNPDEEDANSALTALQEIYLSDLGDPDGYAAFLETIPGYKLDNYDRDTLTFRAAELAFENGNYERAIRGLNDYIGKFPNGRFLLVAHYYRGDAHSALEHHLEALKDYDWVIQQGQSRYFVKALEKASFLAYKYAKEYTKALDYYSRLEGLADSPEKRFQAQLGALASAYLVPDRRKVMEMARKVINNPAAEPHHLAVANFYLGKMAFDDKDYPTALTALDKTIQLANDEKAAEARYLIAYIHYLQRDLETAKNLCLEMNRTASDYPYWVAKAVILLSDIFAEQNDLFNAKAVLEALLKNYDEDPELVEIAKAKLQKLEERLQQESKLDNSSESGNFLLDEGN